MARKIIDTGTLGNPATGDSLRTAMTKINTNFEELYVGNAADGQLTTSVTNGDISIQPNGTGTVEIDAISVNSDNITSLTTNSSVTITGNGTAGVDIEGISVNGTTISSSDSSTININENLIVDGTGDFSGTLSVTGASTLTGGATIDGVSITDNTISTGSSNANLELTASGTGAVKVDAILSLPDGSASDNYAGFGDADDLKIFHNGSHSIIRETGTGSLYLQSDNNIIIGKDSGSETMIKGVADGAVELYYDNVKKLETTADGVKLADDDKIIFGNDDDLEIFHNSSNNNTIIQETGGGNLVIKGSNLFLQSAGSENFFRGVADGAVTLYYDNVAKFETTASGVSVTGTINIDDGISITDNTITSSASNADLELKASGTGSVSVDGIQISGTELSSSDSTQITIKENLHVTGNISGTITGTVTGTIDADNSTISNLEVDNFKASAIVTEGEGIGSNDNDTTIPTSAAVKDYVDNNPTTSLAADNLTTGDAAITIATTTGDITLDTQASNRDIIFKGTDEGVDITPLQLDMSEGGKAIFSGVTIADNTISSRSSNADLELDAAGTGQVVANAAVKFNAGYVEKINTLTSSSTITVDCSLASIHTVTLGTSTEFNITNLPTGGTVTLIITQDGSGSRTATFGTDGSTAVKFPGGAPTLSTGAADIDVVTIVNDGTNFLGNCAKNYS